MAHGREPLLSGSLRLTRLANRRQKSGNCVFEAKKVAKYCENGTCRHKEVITASIRLTGMPNVVGVAYGCKEAGSEELKIAGSPKGKDGRGLAGGSGKRGGSAETQIPKKRKMTDSFILSIYIPIATHFRMRGKERERELPVSDISGKKI